MTRAEFAEIFAELCVAFGVSPSVEQTELYFKFLSRFPLDQFRSAVHRVIETEKGYGRLPEISVILKQFQPSLHSLALNKWARVLELREHSIAHEQDYDPEIGTIFHTPLEVKNDPLLDKAIRVCGGWQKFCSITLDKFDQKTFIDSICSSLETEPDKWSLLAPTTKTFCPPEKSLPTSLKKDGGVK